MPSTWLYLLASPAENHRSMEEAAHVYDEDAGLRGCWSGTTPSENKYLWQALTAKKSLVPLHGWHNFSCPSIFTLSSLHTSRGRLFCPQGAQVLGVSSSSSVVGMKLDLGPDWAKMEATRPLMRTGMWYASVMARLGNRSWRTPWLEVNIDWLR